jgi:SAM-dependent methyltransferase
VKASWDSVAAKPAPSWYLDQVVAEQKRKIHLSLVQRWTQDLNPRTVLKTDLFEEAFGTDHVLFDLAPGAELVVGIDVAQATVAGARQRGPQTGFSFLASDVQNLAFRSESFDLVFSNSTLDHFDTRAELRASLQELVRAVRPGGLLIVTLDNPWNPLYPALRWWSRRAESDLSRWLEEYGMEVIARDWLIHNPRGLSTVLFLGLRRLLGSHADLPIRGLLSLFAAIGKLPSRRFTGCFLAVCARKPHTRSES